MGGLCVCAHSFGWYNDFIPTYVYSVLRAYPHYHVKVFTPDVLSAEVRLALGKVERIFPGGFEVSERFSVSPAYDRSSRCRWLLPAHCFDGFEHAYVGDVDFIIVRENPGILEGHLAHCKVLGLPYSNIVRLPPKEGQLSGLHFFCVRDYFDKMASVIEKWTVQGLGVNLHNEKMLFEMVRECLPVPSCDIPEYRPHHGFHLGLFRINSISREFEVWKTYEMAFLEDPVLFEVAVGKLVRESIITLRRLKKEWGR